MSFWEKAQRVDRRVIYTLMIIAIAGALLRPIGLAISVNQTTKMAYDAIDKLPPGTIVWLGMEFSPGGIPELMPTATSVLRQGLRKGLRFVSGGLWVMAGNFADQAWNEVAPEFPDKKYGVDFVNVGYKPGAGVQLEKMLTDAHGAFAGVDNYGKPLADLPLMKDFKTLKDAKFIFIFVTGTPGEREYMKHVTDVHKIPFAVSCTSVSVPEIMPFVSSGQISGLAAGMRGAAEYEILVNKPGRAVAGMDAQSFAHVLIILFIVVGNVGYLMTGKGKKA